VASKRSFSRIFLISLRPTGDGYTVVKDILSVRAYGGHAAWGPGADLSPEQVIERNLIRQQKYDQGILLEQETQQAVVPQGGIDPKQQMLEQLMQQTGLTQQFAIMALDQTGWNLEQAINAFHTVKNAGQLPPDALIPGAMA